MIKAVLYFLAAGAAGAGGPAAAVALVHRGRQEAAAAIAIHDAEIISNLLLRQMELTNLRDQAASHGVDPRVVEQGYREMLEQIASRLRKLGHE